ncbi:MAG: toll/interleukin-1 receptor domain-containing protein [Ignavibacteriales bacterium]|nr:toll/interleukin-1 receptor domain-containing protein [Ignavibacteriales bacterium]
MQRDIIFISHANPEDDYYAAWLASKLKILGYKVWLDLDDLSAGDSFNTVIKPVIKNQAEIFIALTTKNYTKKTDDQNSGVSRELNCAATINTSELGHNFIIPVRFDNIAYNDFPYHYLGWNGIDFNCNWQQGLIDITNELEKINIKKIKSEDDINNIWFKAIKAQNKPFVKSERYYSNWFGFVLPKNIYVLNPFFIEKETINRIPYPLTLEANHIISFTTKETIEKYIRIKDSRQYATQEFLINEDLLIDTEFTLKEPKKKLIRLLNNSFHLHLRKKGLICWFRGKKSKVKVFYFKNNEQNKQVSLKRYCKPKGRRSLTGQTTEEINGKKQIVNWSFSIIPSADIDPNPHFKISYGIVFCDENYRRFEKTIHHKLRRSVPSDWFNRKWFETLLAAMLKVSNSLESEYIEIEIDENKYLKINNEPFNGISNYGYIEPDNVE